MMTSFYAFLHCLGNIIRQLHPLPYLLVLYFYFFGIEEAKVNRQTFFFSSSSSSLLLILVLLLIQLPTSTTFISIQLPWAFTRSYQNHRKKKNYVRKLMHTGRARDMRKANKKSFFMRFCVEFLLSMFFEHVRNSIEFTRVCVKVGIVNDVHV